MSEKHPQIVAGGVVAPRAPPAAPLLAVSIPAVTAVNQAHCDKLIAIGTPAWPPVRTFLRTRTTLSDQQARALTTETYKTLKAPHWHDA